MFYYFLIYGLSHFYSIAPKYSTAVSEINQAAYKQSGTEAQYNQLQSSMKADGMKVINNNGLASEAAVGGALGSVYFNKKIQVKSSGLTFEATQQGVKAIWTLHF